MAAALPFAWRETHTMTRLSAMSAATALLVTTALIAGCSSTPPPAPPPPPYQPHANLAQLMRGIPFTFSNIVFDAQSTDPAAAVKAADVSGGATAAYKSVYGGWQEVENSALALAETANLILIPGRLCENGRPVPLDREDFREAAQGLVAAGEAAYKAAKTKNLDAMIEVSNTVADACAKCHEPYRDVDKPEDRCIGAPIQVE
jgi:hypothetical protein